MYDRATILHLVNDAERQNPCCACGAPMLPMDRDGSLWLECATRRGPRRDLRSRALSLDWLIGHDRRLILGREELAAA
jgi:hypothetical protein